MNIREDKGIPGQDAGPRVNVRDRRSYSDEAPRRERRERVERFERNDRYERRERGERGGRFERSERYGNAPRREKAAKFDRYEGARQDGGFRKRDKRDSGDGFYTKFAGSKKPRRK